jgi:TatD DNase family protein
MKHPHHHEASDDEHVAACDPDPSKPITDGDAADSAKSASIIADLAALVADGRSKGLVAFGEFGLDYDRLHYCSKAVQLHSFSAQLELAASLEPQLPLFLHSRACHADFVRLMTGAFGPRLEQLQRGGVVHSFTGTVEEARELMDLGLYIGVNGCSFKTAENCAVVREIRLDRLMVETDGPWCEVRASHEGWKYLVKAKAAAEANEDVPVPDKAEKAKKPSKKNQKKEPEVPERFKVVKKEKFEFGAMVKGRNEPCMIERVAKMVAAIKGISVEEVCEAAWANTVKVFGLDE